MPFKINKKVVVVLIIVLAVIVIAGIILLKQFSDNRANVQNSAGGATIENVEQNQEESEVQAEFGDIEIETQGSSSSGGLSICMDKCGDNICQAKDEACPEGSFNCPCEETPAECPQDCQ